MPVVVGISLRAAGKTYFFDPGEERYYRGERVVVETSRGLELGVVKQLPHEVPEALIVPPLRRVMRRATEADQRRDGQNREREAAALTVCKRHVERLKLPMRLISAQYNLEGTHVLIHFLADNRVDFRELVRDLARDLHARIELRQVGVRDEAKLIGGHGMCGRPLCCATFLGNFTPVAISMAKAQGLALNPQKISGTCGRLMCCLAFEYEHYQGIRVTLPKLNAHIETPAGAGKVTKINVLARQIEVTIPEAPAPLWFTIDEQGQAHPASCCAGDGGCGRHGGAPHGGREETDPQPEEEPARLEPLRGRNRRQQGRPGRAPQPERATAPAAEAADETAPDKARRRRKKRPNAPQSTESTPAQATAATAGSEGGEGAARAQRRRKPRPKPAGATMAQPAAAPHEGGIAAAEDGPAMPSGRYRPRRRRGGKGGGGAATPEG